MVAYHKYLEKDLILLQFLELHPYEAELKVQLFYNQILFEDQFLFVQKHYAVFLCQLLFHLHLLKLFLVIDIWIPLPLQVFQKHLCKKYQ